MIRLVGHKSTCAFRALLFPSSPLRRLVPHRCAQVATFSFSSGLPQSAPPPATSQKPSAASSLSRVKVGLCQLARKLGERLIKWSGEKITDIQEGRLAVSKEGLVCSTEAGDGAEEDVLTDWSEEDVSEDKHEMLVIDTSHEDYSDAVKYIKKQNLLKGLLAVEVILMTDAYLEKYQFCHIRRLLQAYRGIQQYFERAFLHTLFAEHLVKHCSHSLIQESEVWLFKEAFPVLERDALQALAKEFYDRCIAYRHTDLPQGFKDNLVREIEEERENLRNEYREEMPDETMRDIESCFVKLSNEFRHEIPDETMRDIEYHIMKGYDYKIMADREWYKRDPTVVF